MSVSRLFPARFAVAVTAALFVVAGAVAAGPVPSDVAGDDLAEAGAGATSPMCPAVGPERECAEVRGPDVPGVPTQVLAGGGAGSVGSDAGSVASTDDAARTPPSQLAAESTGPWRPVQQASPPPRFNGAMASDGEGRVLLFGGCCNLGGYNDTWLWDGTRWEQQFPASSPPELQNPALAYDAARGEFVLFGGLGGPSGDIWSDVYGGASNETWTYDGQDWTKETPEHSPSPRSLAAMAYDAARQEVVLFGGSDTLGLGRGPVEESGITWIWDGEDWTSRTSVPFPTPREAAKMVYDTARQEVVLFGGRDVFACLPLCPGGLPTDTWTWDGIRWTEQETTVSPPGRLQFGMAYDEARQEVVIFSGTPRPNDTWVWDGTDWSERQPSVSPPPRLGHDLAYDAVRGEVLVFGAGSGPAGDDTWTWDGNTWAEVPRVWPAIRYGTAMVQVPGRADPDGVEPHVLAFGGYGGLGLTHGDTWTWDGQAWTQHDLPAAPSPRLHASVAYDEARGEVVLYGGYLPGFYGAEEEFFDDTWTWDGERWTEEDPAVSPPARLAAMAYDAARGEVVLFGGYDAATDETVDETWSWDGTNWTLEEPAASPPPLSYAAMAYHRSSQEIVLFGGYDPADDTVAGETWTWDGTTWTRREPDTSPQPRMMTAVASAPALDSVVVFSGAGDGTGCRQAEPDPPAHCVYNDTWAWDGTTWTELDPGVKETFHPSGAGRPSTRHLASAATSLDGGALLFGGYQYGWPVSEMWQCCTD